VENLIRQTCDRSYDNLRTTLKLFCKSGPQAFMDLGVKYVIVRPLSTVGYASVVASVSHSRQWSN